jgi:hypothetical protein
MVNVDGSIGDSSSPILKYFSRDKKRQVIDSTKNGGMSISKIN